MRYRDGLLVLRYIRNILGPDGTHGVGQGFGLKAFFGYGGSFLERMLKGVFLRLLGRYRIVALSPSAASRLNRQALLLREATVTFGAQLRHARRRFALLLARPPAQLAFRFGVVNTDRKSTRLNSS